MIEASADAPCAIVIPVFNGREALGECLAALERWRPPGTRIVLVDDCSSDTRIAPMLAAFAARTAGCAVVSNASNLGFPGAANAGVAASPADHDVVLLNSDTRVTEGWLDEMRAALASRPDAGVCCPLSNNASILSLPAFNDPGELPPEVSLEAFARLARECATAIAIEVPTAVGFCMAIRRAAWEAAGPFDPAYGPGYGEENDFCERALGLGWKVVCAPRAFVYHRGGASFGQSPAQMARRRVNEELLLSRWPRYTRRVRDFCAANPLRAQVESICHALLPWPETRDTQVLHVLQRWDHGGGIQNHVRDVARATSGIANHTVLVPSPDLGSWVDAGEVERGAGIRVVCLVKPEPEVDRHAFRLLPASETEHRFRRFLAASPASVVHFHNFLGWDTLELPRIAKSLGRAVVITLHEFLLLCPNYSFARPDGSTCRKHLHEPWKADCRECFSLFAGRTMPAPQEPGGLAGHERAARAALELADAIIVPSRHVLERYRAGFGAAIADKMRLVPHLAVTPRLDFPPPPGPAEKCIVSFLGSFERAKGAEVFLAAARELRTHGIAFTIVGAVRHEYAQAVQQLGITASGEYRREELPRLLAQSSIVCVLSQREESYCLTLDEAQASGRAVIATDAGAIPERADPLATKLVRPGDAAAVVRAILALRTALQQARPAMPVPGRPPDAHAYVDLYRALAATRPPALAVPAETPGRQPEAASAFGDPAYREWLARMESGKPAMAPAGAPPRLLRLFGDGMWFDRVLAESDDEWIAIAAESDLLHEGWPLAFAVGRVDFPEALAFFFDDDERSTRGERHAPRFKPGFDARLFAARPDLLDGLCVVRRDALVAAGGVDHHASIPLAAPLLDLATRSGRRSLVRIPFMACSRLDVRVRGAARKAAVAALDLPAATPSGRGAPQVHAVLLAAATVGPAIGPLILSLLEQQGARVGSIDVWQLGEPGRISVPEVTPHPRLRWRTARDAGLALAESSRESGAPFLLVVEHGMKPLPRNLVSELASRRRKDDALVAPKLIDPHGRVHCAGLVLGAGSTGIAAFCGHGAPAHEPGYLGLLGLDRTVGAVSGECALISCDALRDAGGFDARFGVLHVIRELCLRASRKGWQCACLASITAEFSPDSPVFDASAADGRARMEEERVRLLDQWGAELAGDSCHHPHRPLADPDAVVDPHTCVPWLGLPRQRPRLLCLQASPSPQLASALARLRGANRADVALWELRGEARAITGTALRRAGADTLVLSAPLEAHDVAALLRARRHVDCGIVVSLLDAVDGPEGDAASASLLAMADLLVCRDARQARLLGPLARRSVVAGEAAQGWEAAWLALPDGAQMERA